MKALTCLMAVLVSEAQGEQLNVRLSDGQNFESGLVEVWRDGAWGLLCDRGRRGWTLASAHLVCQQLGFARALTFKHGDSGVARVQRGARVAASGISCSSGAGSLASCRVDWGAQCPEQDAVAVVCQPQSRSACGEVE